MNTTAKLILIVGGSYTTYMASRYYQNNSIFSASSKVNYDKLREDIEDILWNKSYEDKHLGPIFVRLAWHSSGTYDAKSDTGGCEGATMRFSKEKSDPANAGLYHAIEFLEPIKKKHPNISYSDLWVYASYVSIESMGGPHIEFCEGRKDATSEEKCPPNGRLPDASKGRKHIRDVFYRMGFNDKEIVALVGGGHALGRCHKDRSGYLGPWNFNPLGFSNLFFKELYNRTWIVKQWEGPKQYVDKESGNLMMLPTDLEIKDDPEFKKYSEKYKDDEKLFYDDFSLAYKKLTELGCKNLRKI